MQRYRIITVDDTGDFVLWSDVQDLIKRHEYKIKSLADTWRLRFAKLKNNLYANLYSEKKIEFQECPACAAKPGMPVLCDVCLHNRALIAELKKKVEEEKNTVDLRGTLPKRSMTGLEIIDTIGVKNLGIEVPCKILFRDSEGNIVGRETRANYTIVDNELVIDARRT